MAEAAPPVFAIPGLRAVELRAEDIPALQRFFDENPAYFLAVNGEPAGPDEGREEFHGELPAGWPFTKQWLLGVFDDGDAMVGMANLTSDLLADQVWHLGLFIVATERHGQGDAQRLHDALEAWAVRGGARWMRLGVVEGNARAERFWERAGYIELRRRHGVAMGRRVNTLRVMVKRLGGGTLADYLARVPRDRADPAETP